MQVSNKEYLNSEKDY